MQVEEFYQGRRGTLRQRLEDAEVRVKVPVDMHSDARCLTDRVHSLPDEGRTVCVRATRTSAPNAKTAIDTSSLLG